MGGLWCACVCVCVEGGGGGLFVLRAEIALLRLGSLMLNGNCEIVLSRIESTQGQCLCLVLW